MTGFAFGVHEKLIKTGYDPVKDGDKYYDAIDEAMRKRFPDKFDEQKNEEEAPVRQTGSVVAPANRSAKKTTQSATNLNTSRPRKATWYYTRAICRATLEGELECLIEPHAIMRLVKNVSRKKTWQRPTMLPTPEPREGVEYAGFAHLLWVRVITPMCRLNFVKVGLQ